MRKILLLLVVLFVTGCTEKNVDKPITDYQDLPYYEYLSEDNPNVTIVFDDNSEIKIQLFPEVAPNTVNNFLELAENDFYDGIIFHRVIDGFVMQGGDPEGTGVGGADYNIIGEFTQNNFENDLPHYRGVISMARSQNPNSASSQFFLVDETNNGLDGLYAGFGGILEGFDVLDKFTAVETDENDKPIEDIKIKDIIVDTKGKDYDEPVRLEKEFFTADEFLNESNQVAEFTLSNDQVIEVQLFDEVAPITVENFISLVNAGFYNGLKINRVFKDFVILAGDSVGDGTGEAGEPIYGEFKANGYNNNLSHTKGVISMFSIDNNSSSSSQFFIVTKDSIALDGTYAAFGYITNGLDVIDTINAVEVTEEYQPVEDIIIESVVIK